MIKIYIENKYEILSKIHYKFYQRIILSIFLLFFILKRKFNWKQIEYKVDNEIITSIDINNEKKLLLSLNPNLVELNQKKLLEISIESTIREKIKKIEINKYKKEIEIDDGYLSKLIEENYKKINFTSKKNSKNSLMREE